MAKKAEERRVLSKFMDIRYDLDRQYVLKKHLPTPIITLARDKGCHVTPLANKLIKELNARNHPALRRPDWMLYSKSIVETSAKRLQLQPEKLESLVNQKEKSILEEILTSLRGEYYPSEKHIMKTIKEIILAAAKPGYLVVLGRGGVGITRFKNALHVRITAPLEWRIKQLMDNYSWKYEEAKSYVKKIDEKRAFMRNYFLKKQQLDMPFDLTFNMETLSEQEIVETIADIIDLRKKSH